MAEDRKASVTFSSGSEPFFELFCQPCREENKHLEAHGYCQDCQDYLCRDCYDNHRKPRPMRHHILLNKDEMPTTPPPSKGHGVNDACTQRCEKHSKEVIKYHCPKHDVVVCGVCVTLSHFTCGVNYIPDIAKGIGDSHEYKKLYQTVFDMIKKVGETIQQSKKNLLNTQECYDGVMRDVQQLRKEMNEMMDMLESKIKTEAETLKSADIEQMNSTIEMCNKFLTEIHAVRTQLEKKKDSKQECNLFIEMKSSNKKLRALQRKVKEYHNNNHVTYYAFDRSDDLWDFVNNTSAYGKLVQRRQPRQHSRISSISHVKDIPLNLKETEGTQKPTMTGLVLLQEDKLVAVDTFKNNMYVFDIEKFERNIIMNLPASPWDVTRIRRDSVAVTFTYEKEIVCYRVGAGIEKEREMPTSGTCAGIAYQKERFYVSFTFPDVYLEILDSLGVSLCRIIHDCPDNALIMPDYITVHNNSIIVSDSGSNKISKVNRNGDLEWEYGAADLIMPLGLTVNHKGSIVVCAEKSNNICIISPQGKLEKVLLSEDDGLKPPQTLVYCERTGRLLVTEDSGDRLRIYQTY